MINHVSLLSVTEKLSQPKSKITRLSLHSVVDGFEQAQ